MRRISRIALCQSLALFLLGAGFPLLAQAPASQESGLTIAGATDPASPLEAAGASPRLSRAPAILPDDPAPLLGLNLDEAYGRLGAPVSVSVFRGVEAWQDDVVFAYPPGYSLFWFGDRLWQIRFQPGYAGSIYGVFLGDSADKIYSLLGTPLFAAEDSLVYRLPYRGFPVRLRIALAGGRAADLYLYRADF